jgi:hypothetical protein
VLEVSVAELCNHTKVAEELKAYPPSKAKKSVSAEKLFAVSLAAPNPIPAGEEYGDCPVKK